MKNHLETHMELCEQLYLFILKENQFLKETGKPLDSTGLEEKRNLLQRLEGALSNLRSVSTRPSEPDAKALIQKITQLILKTLLIDRENEQLLLKATFSPPTKAQPKATASHLRQIYFKSSPAE